MHQVGFIYKINISLYEKLTYILHRTLVSMGAVWIETETCRTIDIDSLLYKQSCD